MRTSRALALAALLVLGACAAPVGPPASETSRPAPSGAADPVAWPDVPAVPDGDLAPEVEEAVDRLVADFGPGRLDRESLGVVAASSDARLGWLLADLLRFTPPGDGEAALLDAFRTVTDVDPTASGQFGRVPWVAASNLLIGWDLPAPPGYREDKATIYLAVEPAWEPFFADVEATLDWRWVSWGGVLIDDREVGDATPCRGGCIPALDDPALTSAEEGDWYAGWRPVFGFVVGDEAVAFPRNMLEVHELVNVTVGGRRVGMPYCTLCASAHAYLLDGVDGADAPLVLRTSGLLSRSNKVMYDLRTMSAFNTFTGRATSGPLLDAGVVLEPVPVVATTWEAWRAEHPDTRFAARDGGIGRVYPDDPLEGRDEAGPIFPIGRVDPRLRAQHRVVGAIGPDGPVAVPVDEALAVLEEGGEVRIGDVEAFVSGGGLRLRAGDGDLATHPAFWFAWSQFHPATALWQPDT